MIAFVTDKQKDQFDDARINPLLRALGLLVNGYCEHKFDTALWVTSIYRDGEGSVHNHWRGLDCDNDHLNHEELKEACAYINWLFEYNEEKPHLQCALFHTVKKDNTGWHIHLQTHPHTKLR